MAVGGLGIAPSEVRNMTPHEIVAVVKYKAGQGSGDSLSESDKDELYDMLMEARSGNSQHA